MMDWIKIAKLAGEHGIRYASNNALEAFLRDIGPHEQTNASILDALKDAHKTLQIASRQLTEDHKMVLMGRAWGRKTLATIEGVIAKAEGKA